MSQVRHAVTTGKPAGARAVRILAVVEATDVNAIAKNVMEFHRSALELGEKSGGSSAVETSLVTFDRANDRADAPNEFVAAARAMGMEVEVIPERFRFDPRVVPALRRAAARVEPDLIVTHQVKSHLLLKLSRLWRRSPWVAFHHGYTRTMARVRVYNQMNRLSLPYADRVITVCGAFAGELTKAGVRAERILVQHNSIRPEKAAGPEEAEALRARLGVSGEERVVLAVGRLSAEKAHADLLSAFRLLPEAAPGVKVKLVIVGDGPERVRLEEAAAAHDLSDKVLFVGQISDVSPYYAAADVLALPSHTEGSPYVLLEAMAAGLPVVATAVGGVPEMVADEESALLVPARDPRAMAAALARVLTDGRLARGLAANASALVTTRYSPETYVRSLLGIYREVIAGAPPSQKV